MVHGDSTVGFEVDLGFSITEIGNSFFDFLLHVLRTESVWFVVLGKTM